MDESPIISGRSRGHSLNTVISLAWCFWFLFATEVHSAQKEAIDSAPGNEIKHSPQQPRSNEPVTITARLIFPAKSVALEYQIVEPGRYITLKDAEYNPRWVSVPMTKSSADSTAFYSVQVPGNIQTNRRLVRYRVKATNGEDTVILLPAADDPEPNLAYFVYDGIPPWKAAIQPKSSDPKKAEMVEFGTNVMTQVQNYFLIGKAKEIESATWYERSSDKEYKYTGTFVSDGKVYDHIRFRARGGAWRHAMGKNMWKIDFNKSHPFQARDDYGRKYKTKWRKLNLRSCIQQSDFGRRGEQGMYESVGFRLFNLVGADAPRTHWISWRIIDEAAESPPDQYHGDF